MLIIFVHYHINQLFFSYFMNETQLSQWQVGLQVDYMQKKLKILKKNISTIFSENNMDLCLQYILFYGLSLYDVNQQLTMLKSQKKQLINKTSIFYKIQECFKAKNQKMNDFQKMNKRKTSRNQQALTFLCECINQYRICALKYVEQIILMCQKFSNNSSGNYFRILSKCKKIFINLQQQNTIMTSILQKQFELQNGFDPLLLNIKLKGDKNKQIQKLLCFDIKTSNRLIEAHKEMLKSVEHNQNKNHFQSKKFQTIHVSNKKLLITPQRLKNYEISGSYENKRKVSSVEVNKKSSSIQSRRKGTILKRKSQVEQEKMGLSPFNNHSVQINRQTLANMSYRKRMSVSVDNEKKNIFGDKTPKSIVKNSIDERNFNETRYNRNISNTKNNSAPINLTHQVKKLNFKATNLQPLQNKSLVNLQQSFDKPIFDKIQTKKNLISSYRLKRSKLKNFKNLQIKTDISSENDNIVANLSDNNSYQNVDKKIQFKPKQQKKLADILFNLKNQKKFQTDDDKSQLLDNQSPRQYYTKEDIEITFRNNMKNLNNRTDECPNNRKRHIKEVNQDVYLSPKRQNGRQNNEFAPKEIQKVKIQKYPDETNDKQKNKKEILNYENEVDSKKHISEIPQNHSTIIDPSIMNLSIVDPVPGSIQIINKPHQNKQTMASPHINNAQSNNLQKALTKKIILKATKISQNDLKYYISNHNISNENKLIQEIKTQQHYICQFYLDQMLFIVLVFSISNDYRSIQIKLIQLAEKNIETQYKQQKDQNKFKKIIIKKFIEILEKSSSRRLKNVVVLDERYMVSDSFNNKWLIQCGFKKVQDGTVYQLERKQQKTNDIKQFLSIQGSLINLVQSNSQSLVYSDQISQFKVGKYDVSQQIFKNQSQAQFFKDFNIQTFNKLQNLSQINQILQTKNFDNYDIQQQSQKIIIALNQNRANGIQLKLISFNQVLSQYFTISNGWIKTVGQFILNQKNLRIVKINLQNQHEIYFGKGFEHIVTMKNKITHYKTKNKFNNQKSQQQDGNNSKKQPNKSNNLTVKIRMFNKQLYGLIKYSQNQAYYGNWQMNFHYKHQFMGKVLYNFDTNPGQNRVIFGNQSFFVTLYKNDQFLLGWQVQQNDFLY